MPLGPIGQEFWPEYNVDIFARKFIDSIFKSSKKEMEKSFARKKKNWLNLVQKHPLVLLAKKFDQNTILAFLHENL